MTAGVWRGLVLEHSPYPPPAQVVLQEYDLLPASPDYLRPVAKESFEPNGIRRVFFRGELRKLAIVLPLDIGSGMVVPIPFICDSGTPGSVYLGTGR